MKAQKTSPAPFDPPQWPATNPVMRKLSAIKPYPNNPRTHPQAQVKMLSEIMKRRGVDQPIVVDEKSVILKGHGRLLAATMAGFEEYPVVEHFGLPEADKLAMRIEDNQVALLAGWDETLIRSNMIELASLGYDVKLLGFENAQLIEFSTPMPQEPDGRGRLLELVNITIDEPKTKVEIGHHFLLSGRHHLLCESVITGWVAWAPLLTGDALFCPYPGVFVPFGSKGKAHPLIMVQGDPYIAGHIVDRWTEAYGKKSVKRVTK